MTLREVPKLGWVAACVFIAACSSGGAGGGAGADGPGGAAAGSAVGVVPLGGWGGAGGSPADTAGCANVACSASGACPQGYVCNTAETPHVCWQRYCSADGDRCIKDEMCRSWSCLPSGVCAPTPPGGPLGTVCDDTELPCPPSVCPPNPGLTCAPGLVCLSHIAGEVEQLTDPRCAAPPEVDQLCTTDLIPQCATGLYCLIVGTNGSGRPYGICMARGADGASCSIATETYTSFDGTAATQQQAVSPCQDGLTCLAGHCAMLDVGEGGPCTASPTQQPQCAAGLVCKGTTDGSTSVTMGTCAKSCGTCTSGEPCTADADCPRLCPSGVACVPAGTCGGKDQLACQACICPTCDLSMCPLSQ